jgi:hypothetical protein
MGGLEVCYPPVFQAVVWSDRRVLPMRIEIRWVWQNALATGSPDRNCGTC